MPEQVLYLPRGPVLGFFAPGPPLFMVKEAQTLKKVSAKSQRVSSGRHFIFLVPRLLRGLPLFNRTDRVAYITTLLTVNKMADKSKPRNTESYQTGKFDLPIRNYKSKLVKAVEENDFLVVVGETGSGKTTQLPQYLHKAGHTSIGKMIGVTQPRRIAAISVATRVSQEMKSQLGGESSGIPMSCIQYLSFPSQYFQFFNLFIGGRWPSG